MERLLEQSRLTHAIVRNRKRTVGGFTSRTVRRLPVELSDEELEVHERLSEYLARGFASAQRHRDRLLGFELVTFQRLLASSSRASARATG